MEQEYAVAFELITHAGDSRSSSMLALKAARRGDLDEAARLLTEAEAGLLSAHRLQMQLVQGEVNGDRVPVNVVLVHAQDHLTSAIVVRDLAGEIIELYRTLQERARPAS